MKKIDIALAQQIAESVKEVCEHDINFIDEKGIIFASTDKSRIKDFHEAGFLSAKNGENVIVTKNDTTLGSLQGINIPIFFKGNFIAVIGISGEPQAAKKYADLAIRITKLFLREREVFDYNRTKQEKMNSIVNALITNDLSNRSTLKSTLNEMKIKEADSLCVILFRINQNSHSDITPNEQFLFQLFHKMDFPLYTYHYPDEYIVITKEENLSLQINLLREFAKQHQMILVGVGGCKPMYQLMQSYETAQLALQSTKHLDCNFCEFNQLDIEILLSSLDTKTISNYTNKTVLSLNKEDQQLLSVYYSENMSLQRTSNRLYLHKNTIQYRLDKIARLTGYNPRSFRDALVLYLGILLSD